MAPSSPPYERPFERYGRRVLRRQLTDAQGKVGDLAIHNDTSAI